MTTDSDDAPDTATVAAWIAADPDPDDRAELESLPEDELPQRFSAPLRFGTAGLRGPLQAGPAGMNLAVVLRTSAGLAQWLTGRCGPHGPSGEVVVVGRDARHRSAQFAQAAAETLAAAGFQVVLLPRPLPTPIVAYAVRELGAIAGVQVTASHNPPGDNGYKVYLRGGAQLVSPADREIEAAIAEAPRACDVPRSPVSPAGDDLVERYVARAACAAGSGPADRGLRIALTPLHGVGGRTALAALHRAGFTDVHPVASQFDPDPDFPTVDFPNPEEPGATDALLALAADVDAVLAIALDPDADRCALGVRGPNGWRMLRGDETGVLLGADVLDRAAPGALVATTIVSSQLLPVLAAARGARCAVTLTGFKWLVRAGEDLRFAYEEALGLCVDPDAVRDKDGISAAVLACALAARLKARGRTLWDILDDIAVEFGVYAQDQVSVRADDLDEIAAAMHRWRTSPPTMIAGVPVRIEDLARRDDELRTDAVICSGAADAAASIRAVVRPSGTEPKLKIYLEAVVPVADRASLAAARTRAAELLARARADFAW